jgi:hypothetical protein
MSFMVTVDRRSVMTHRRAHHAYLVCVLAAGLTAAPSAAAQPSTGKLWPDQPWVVDVAAGPELAFLTGGLFGGSDGREGNAFGIMGAARGRLATHVFLGVTGWHLQRSSNIGFGAASRSNTDRITTLGVEAMMGLPVHRRVRVSATGGLGAAISVRSSGGIGVRGSGSGSMPMFGVTLEVGRLQLSQKALLLLGAEDVIVEFREYFPVTVGWRF